MIRGVFSTLSNRVTCSLGLTPPTTRNGAFSFLTKSIINQQNASFASLKPTNLIKPQCQPQCISNSTNNTLLEQSQVLSQQIRTVTKFSYNKGRRKSVGAVRERFFRLHWGIWIRTIAGRHKKLWKKNKKQKNFYINHVFCNATQSRMLDKMVNKFWRKPKYYIEDPYEYYHKRENFFITQTKPWRPEGVDYE